MRRQHPFANISREVDLALERVERAAETQRTRRLNSKHPKTDPAEVLIREEAKTVEFRVRAENEDTLDLDDEAKKDPT